MQDSLDLLLLAQGYGLVSHISSALTPGALEHKPQDFWSTDKHKTSTEVLLKTSLSSSFWPHKFGMFLCHSLYSAGRMGGQCPQPASVPAIRSMAVSLLRLWRALSLVLLHCGHTAHRREAPQPPVQDQREAAITYFCNTVQPQHLHQIQYQAHALVWAKISGRAKVPSV